MWLRRVEKQRYSAAYSEPCVHGDEALPASEKLSENSWERF